MQHTKNVSPVSATVHSTEEQLEVQICDRRQAIASRFVDLSEEQAIQLARDAWQIGLRAVLQAHAQAEEAKLGDVGKTLLADVESQLDRFRQQQEQDIKSVLGHYFDPKVGQVSERLRAFVDDQGVLAKLLEKFVGCENSVLTQSLAQQVGESSPLFKALSPTESEGVVQLLELRFKHALEQNRSEVQRALDPLAKDGAVHRFLSQLREQLDTADEGRQGQLTRALAALDQNDEQSLISTLLRESRAAHDALRRAVNPQLPDSPLATVRRTLEELIVERLGTQEKRLATMADEQRRFQLEVQQAVARFETRNLEQARSARGGDLFEEQVLAFIHRVVPAGVCTLEATGRRTGLRSGCKKGDAVLRFGEESAFSGSAVVFEAKRDKSYGIGEALTELELAQQNRGAEVGLFVMAKASAGDNFPGFARYGSRLVVTWDPNDPVSDGLLHGAIVAAMGLVQRKKSSVDRGDINALADVEQRLIKELERLSKIDKSSQAIRNHADKISDEVRKGGKALERVVGKAKATLRALNIELRDEEAERQSPIEAPLCTPVPTGEAESPSVDPLRGPSPLDRAHNCRKVSARMPNPNDAPTESSPPSDSDAAE